MIRLSVDIFVLDLLILCLQDKLKDLTNLSSPNNFKKNDDIISKYFVTND